MDEGVMASELWRSHRHAPTSGTVLGPLDLVPDGCGREFVLGRGRGAFRMFVVRRGQEAFGYVNLCPHSSLPLNQRVDDFMSADGSMIRCTRHFALFRVEDGACLGGACGGAPLDAVPLTVQGEALVVI